MGNIHFTPKDILQKDFKQKMRGYDPTDVDSFLDMIIRDYETFNKSIQQLQDENDQLRQKVDHLTKTGASNNISSPQMTQTPNDQESQSRETTTKPDNDTYINILKRLANLENHVFGHSMNQTHNPNQF